MEEFFASITVETFKTTYKKSFKYLPVWQDDILYFPLDKVYFLPTKRFYEAVLQNENITPQDTTNWKVAQDNILLYVSDDDILTALNSAKNKLGKNNCFLTFNEAQKKEVLLMLTAHYLYETLMGDADSGNAGLIETSTTVGNVSQSYTIPDWIKQSTNYSLYSNTPYGVKYLAFMKTNCHTLTRFDTNRKC